MGPTGRTARTGRTGTGVLAGPQGDQGPQGTQGTAGAQGPKGDTGARGPAGRDATVTCKPGKKKKGRVRVTCTVRFAATGKARARLSRHGVVYAHGSGRVTRHAAALDLHTVRRTPPGEYTMRVRFGGGRLAVEQGDRPLRKGRQMKMRAAVLEEFGAAAAGAGGRPGGAAGRRGARPPGGLRRLPHRPLHGLGRRPVGLLADACSATRARASSSAVGDGVNVARRRRPRRDAVLAAVPRVRPLPRARAPTSASRSASSRTRATCRTARRGSRATASRSATSWARRRSPSTR